MKILEKILTYFEVKLAALILKKVALDSAATALAFKNHKGKYYMSSITCFKMINTSDQLKYKKRISKNIRHDTVPSIRIWHCVPFSEMSKKIYEGLCFFPLPSFPKGKQTGRG